ncbi:MAG TPA: hemolysin family protein [Pyrinomonadaceae bacterium]|nr:hemolysin family protein [Pyrinomonadaceae bacterium]
MITALKLVATVLIVAINGFFVAAEFALVGVRRSRIETLVEGGDRRAKRLLGILDNLNAYLSASQLGITLASLALAILGEPTIAHLLEGPFSRINLGEWFGEWGRHAAAFVIAYAILTSLHIVLGEQAPKLVGLERAERVAMWSALPMELFYKFFSWPIRLLDWASAAVVRPFGMNATSAHASIYTEEEIRQLINASHKGGHLEEEEQQLINRVFDFSEAEVREAMIPRTAVAAIPVTATLEEVEETFCETGYSRLPVYRDQLDNIVGVIFMKDIMPCLKTSGRKEFDMEQMIHPPMFVPATARLGAVLAQMQSARTHLAFAIDEHGGIEGILTLEDLLEEIVGEIDDEYDEEVRAQIVEEDGHYVLDGMLAVRDANRKFKLKLPEDAGYTTLAGFLLARAGRILKQGETVEHEGASFTIERVDRHRIRRIRFTPAPPPPSEEAEDTAA